MWKPEKTPKSRLLFDSKPAEVVKIVSKGDTSDFYHITQAILLSNILPETYAPPMKVVQTNPDGEQKTYRVTIWHDVAKKGKRVWKSFWVRVVGPDEFVFEPPITEI